MYYFSHGTKSTQWTHPRTGKKKSVSGGEKSFEAFHLVNKSASVNA